jgi:hypothetical protein
MVTGVLTVTGFVVIWNWMEVCPARTVTVAGTVASALLEVILTASPPVAAIPERVTVPVVLTPPTREDDPSVKVDIVGTVTTRAVDFVELPMVATRSAVTFAETALVGTENVMELVPAATVSLVGMVTAVLLEARLTTSPEGPARPLTDSVKFTLVPPTTEGDATEKLDILGRFTVKVVLWEVLLKVAVIVTTVVELTGCESRSKVAVDFPAGTNSVAGMVTAGLLPVEIATESPEGPAGPVRFTVRRKLAPPVTAPGDTVTLPTVAGVTEIVEV